MSYDRALDVRECVRKALEGVPVEFDPNEGLCTIFDALEDTRIDASGYEVIKALQEVDESMCAAFVEMLTDLYLETMSACSCGPVDDDPQCDWCKGQDTEESARLDGLDPFVEGRPDDEDPEIAFQ